MYNTTVKECNSVQELLDYLGNLSLIKKDCKTAIVGGHFMLMYDKSEDRLKPMIWQDLDKPEEIDYAQMFAGDFPLTTFDYSLQLHENFKGKGHESGIALLVNDHKFQHHNKDVNGRGGDLRKSYYKDNSKIPNGFKELIQENNLDASIIIENNNSKRQKTDLLPKQTFFYSEQMLRNRFDGYTRKEILKDENFSEVKSGKASNLVFHSIEQRDEICLTESGACECAGEVIEFILEILRSDFGHVIFFVPDECKNAVNNGVEAALYLAEKSALEATVQVISGVGGIGGIEQSGMGPIEVHEHKID